MMSIMCAYKSYNPIGKDENPLYIRRRLCKISNGVSIIVTYRFHKNNYIYHSICHIIIRLCIYYFVSCYIFALIKCQRKEKLGRCFPLCVIQSVSLGAWNIDEIVWCRYICMLLGDASLKNCYVRQVALCLKSFQEPHPLQWWYRVYHWSNL